MPNPLWALTVLALLCMATGWWWSAAVLLALTVLLRFTLRTPDRRRVP